jgi:nitroreductase
MMLAAWNEGVASCPNGMPEAAKTAEVLGLVGEERPAVVLSFGYPVTPRDPQRLTAEEWSARADRKPLAELVERR